MKRRDLCKAISLSVGAGLIGLPPLARGVKQAVAQDKRALEIQLLGFVLGIQVPANAAIVDIMPETFGYAGPKIARLGQVRVITQTMIGGTADIGTADLPTVLSAVEAGAKLKVVGKMYDKTTHVLVANADKIRSFADLVNPNVRVSVGTRGEVSQIMLFEPLRKRGIDANKATNVEMPGSGSRMNALLAGRIDATYMHFDQFASIAGKGNFRALIEPWSEFPAWWHEVWTVRADWLEKPQNQRALVDLLKANIIAFRKANSDFDWFLQMYRKHASLKDAKTATEAAVRPNWERIRNDIKAWPNDMKFTLKEAQSLVPAYVAAEAIRGMAKVEDVVEPKYVEQALKELG
ncbi:MAG: ABC transporter substrate-binding protein [Rhodospirillales bacterium]